MTFKIKFYKTSADEEATASKILDVDNELDLREALRMYNQTKGYAYAEYRGMGQKRWKTVTQ